MSNGTGCTGEKGVSSHPLLLLLPGDVAPLDLPVAQEVAEVAEDGQDAVAHVGEHGHQHGRLLEVLDEGPAVQAAAVVRRCVDLKNSGHKSFRYGLISYIPYSLDLLIT